MTFDQWIQLVNSASIFATVILSWVNMNKINVVHKLTNSLADKNSALSMNIGLAEGEIIGRKAEKEGT